MDNKDLKKQLQELLNEVKSFIEKNKDTRPKPDNDPFFERRIPERYRITPELEARIMIFLGKTGNAGIFKKYLKDISEIDLGIRHISYGNALKLLKFVDEQLES